MKKLGLYSLMLLFLFSACRKDVNNVGTSTTVPNPTIIEDWTQEIINVNGSVTGIVVDEDNEPMPGVSIKLGNNTATTDNWGHFFYTDITLNAAGTYLTADSDGYFQGSRRFFPKENAESRVKIQLIPKNFDMTFDAQSGGTVGTNFKIEFGANTIKNEVDGSAYTGTVHVAAKWLDPTNPATFNEMPGNLQGVNSSLTEVVLSTYGMLAVELEGDAGQPLNIADGETALIAVDVPNELVANAPSEIPLWSFDETVGMWAEEGTATFDSNNNRYTGTVSHFSFWNCDAPFPLINLDFHLEDDNGNVLDNYHVQIEFNNTGNAWGSVGYGISDSNGDVSGKVPANEELTIRVYSECGDVLFETTVGPYSSDTSLGTLTVPTAGLTLTTFNGTLVDCNGNPVNDGVVVVSEGDIDHYHYPASATFSYTRLTCGISTLTVKGINIVDLVESAEVSATQGIVNNLGNISVCGNQLQNYLLLTVDGVDAIFLDAQFSSNPASNSTNISTQDSLQQEFIYLGFSGVTTGSYGGFDNYIEIIQSTANNWNITNNQGGFTSFEVTEYGPNLIGSFSGEVTNIVVGPNGTTTTEIVQCSGEFNIIQ